MENQQNEEKQMTAMVYPKAGASSTYDSWNVIDWQTAVAHVRRLQMRSATRCHLYSCLDNKRSTKPIILLIVAYRHMRP